MKPTHTFLALAASAAFLISAGGAQAASTTYCVAAPGCTGTDVAGLQNALDWAQGTPEPDRLEIGPGEYFPGPGKFTYAGSATNTLDIVGAGRDQTHLVFTSNSASLLVLDYADVSDLEVHGASPDTAFPNRPAAIDIAHGTARRLEVTNGVSGALLHDGAALAASHVTGSGKGPDTYGVEAPGFKTAVLDSVIDSPSQGAFASSSLEIARTRISAPLGVYIHSGGNLHLTDSLIEGPAQGSNVGVFAQGSADIQAAISGTTIVEPAPSSAGVLARGLNGGNVNVSVENSVVVAENSFVRQSNLNPTVVTVGHSAFDPSTALVQGPGSFDFAGTNVNVTPGFVDPAAGDYRLRPDSALIDKGAASAAGELDLAGAARSLDGDGDGSALPDIGAFESPAVAPKDPPAGDPGAPDGDPKPPVGEPAALPPALSAVSLTHRRFKVHKAATAFRFKLSEDAKVTIKVGRHKVVKAARLGKNRIAFSGRFGRRALKPGRYVAKLTARDAGGRASKGRRVKFKILRTEH